LTDFQQQAVPPSEIRNPQSEIRNGLIALTDFQQQVVPKSEIRNPKS
jgi:hypothetical protein